MMNFGIIDALGIRDQKTLYGANIFNRDSNKTEFLKEISVSNFVNMNYEVYINAEDGDLSPEKLQKVELENTYLKAGYNTIKFANPIKLTGDKFAVVCKYSSGSKAFVGVELPLEGLWETATSNYGESYLSKDGKNWSDLKTLKDNANICIKAFTEEIDIVLNKYSLYENEILYKILPETTKKQFFSDVSSSGNLEILDSNNNVITDDNAFICTGMKLRINNDKEFTLVVTGDIKADGKITPIDLAKVNRHILNIALLDDKVLYRAADINYDGQVTPIDLAKINRHILGIELIQR